MLSRAHCRSDGAQQGTGSDEIKPELNELVERLKDNISDERKRRQVAYQIFDEKYSATRGFEMIGEFCHQILQNSSL